MQAEDIKRLKQQEYQNNNYLPKVKAVSRVVAEIEHELKLIKNHVEVELYDTTQFTDTMLQQNLELLTDILEKLRAR